MKRKKEYLVKAKIWIYSGQGAWHFVTISQDISKEISEKYKHMKKGFGSIKVEVKIDNEKFQTSIFPESKFKTYMLPIKKEIRKKVGIQEGDIVNLKLKVL